MIHIEIPPYDGELTPEGSIAIPKKAGLYAFYAKDDELLYVGKTKNLFTRVRQHCLGNDSNTGPVSHNIAYLHYWIIESETDLEIYETYMINTLKPAWNKDKVYTYKTRRYHPRYRIPEELEEELRELAEYENREVYDPEDYSKTRLMNRPFRH